MKTMRGDTLYGLVVVTLLLGVALALRVSHRHQRAVEAALLQRSLYGEPWEAPQDALWCVSELNLQQAHIPFTVWIEHPPGTRETLNETIRRLVRTGEPPQPWPEDALGRYAILGTRCERSWQAVYAQKWQAKSKIHALLENPDHPTEADYRQAILRQEFGPMGTADAALAWFPVSADTPERRP